MNQSDHRLQSCSVALMRKHQSTAHCSAKVDIAPIPDSATLQKYHCAVMWYAARKRSLSADVENPARSWLQRTYSVLSC